MSPRSFNPFWFLELCVSVFEAHFTKPEPEKQQQPLREVVWEIGPDGYLRGR